MKSIRTIMLALLALGLLFAGQPLRADEVGAQPPVAQLIDNLAEADGGADVPLLEAAEYDFSSVCLSSPHENQLCAELPVEVLSKLGVAGCGITRPREPASIVHRRHYVYCSALLPRPPSL